MSAPASGTARRPLVPRWRRESLRTTLWLVPSIMVVGACLLFLATYVIDRAAADGRITLPDWLNSGGPDVARTVLTAIAAAIITVVGVVFSIVILALTLASTQFGPRLLRNFIRDLGTQVTLGAFVATFVYCVLALGSIRSTPSSQFVPHLSVTVALGLVLVDLGVLIYFIHHVAVSIQLNEVIAGIGGDLARAIEQEIAAGRAADHDEQTELEATVLERRGEDVLARRSGYLQVVSHDELLDIAVREGVTVRLLFRPGHFVSTGRPLANVWPAERAGVVARALDRAHVTGKHRTLSQDLVFAVDQLVEIAIRALSPAVNDTFTALTCIDWLTDGLTRLEGRSFPSAIYRDEAGGIRLIQPGLRYRKVVDRSFDKIRQAARGMPAVLIRQLEALTRIAEGLTSQSSRQVIRRQADMIVRESEDSVPEVEDRDAVSRRYNHLLGVIDHEGVLQATQQAPLSG